MTELKSKCYQDDWPTVFFNPKVLNIVSSLVRVIPLAMHILILI